MFLFMLFYCLCVSLLQFVMLQFFRFNQEPDAFVTRSMSEKIGLLEGWAKW